MDQNQFNNLCRNADLSTIKAAVQSQPELSNNAVTAFDYAIRQDNVDVAKYLYNRYPKQFGSPSKFEMRDYVSLSKLNKIERIFIDSFHHLHIDTIALLHEINPMHSNIIIQAITYRLISRDKIDWCIQHIKIPEISRYSVEDFISCLIRHKCTNIILTIIPQIFEFFASTHSSYNHFFKSIIDKNFQVESVDNTMLYLVTEMIKYKLYDSTIDAFYMNAFTQDNWPVITHLDSLNYRLSDDVNIEKWIEHAVTHANDKLFYYITKCRPQHNLSASLFSKICRLVKKSELSSKIPSVLSFLQHCTTINRDLYLEVVDGVLVTYSTNSYYKEIETVDVDPGYTAQKLGIKPITNIFICESCAEPHTEIILLPCGHCWCLKSLLKIARRLSDGNQCTTCRAFYKWPDCFEITNQSRFSNMKSA